MKMVHMLELFFGNIWNIGRIWTWWTMMISNHNNLSNY